MYFSFLRAYKTIILIGLYISLCLVITFKMNFLITDAPIEGDAEQNFRMAYNKYKYGILSSDRAENVDYLKHGNYREPLPPLITSFFMHAHPGINKNQSYTSFINGLNTKKIKQVNLVWILFLLIGLGGLCYSITKSPASVLTTFVLTVFYFIRFGNHFDKLITELPAAALMILSTWLLFSAIKEHRVRLYFFAGIFLGLLVLVKATFLYLTPLILIFLFCLDYFKVKRYRNITLYKNTSMFFFGAVIIIIPWMVRNKVFVDDFQVTQRGGIVLHYRAIHNQMTASEIKGAFHFFGPAIYQSFSNRVFNIKDKDFDSDGKFRRLNRSHSSDRTAISDGNTGSTISFYAYTRAERSRLVDYYSNHGIDSPFRKADKDLGDEAKKIILENPVKHIMMTPVFLWRGIWCFPNSTIPWVGNTLQLYINNAINFLAFLSLCIILLIAIRNRDPGLLALIILPCAMILFQSIVSHNIPRYSQPAIPMTLLCLVYAIQYLLNLLNKKSLYTSYNNHDDR